MYEIRLTEEQLVALVRHSMKVTEARVGMLRRRPELRHHAFDQLTKEEEIIRGMQHQAEAQGYDPKKALEPMVPVYPNCSCKRDFT